MTNPHMIKEQYSIPNVDLNGKSEHRHCTMMKTKTSYVINLLIRKKLLFKKLFSNHPSVKLSHSEMIRLFLRKEAEFT